MAKPAAVAAKAAGGIKGFLKGHPISAGIGAAATIPFALNLGIDTLGGPFMDAFGGGARRSQQESIQQRLALVRKLRRAQQLRQVAASNVLKLRQLSPSLVGELVAGRRLPMDATVIGGQPRTDLLEELGMRMAQQGGGQVDPMQMALHGIGGAQ